MLIPMEIPPALINRGAGRRRRSRKCFVAARLREKVGRTATKRLLLFQRDFHASNAKVQAGTFGVRGGLYNDTFGIFEVPYSAADSVAGGTIRRMARMPGTWVRIMVATVLGAVQTPTEIFLPRLSE
jgi:hypothetical protein